jgi:predicted dehydrogenase
MYLRAEERELGKENFAAAIGSKGGRREFLMKAIRQGLTPRSGLGGYYFNYKKPEKPLAVGLLGAGEQGRRLIAAINPDYIAVKAVADLRPSSLDPAIAGDLVPPTPADLKKNPEAKPTRKSGTGLVGIYKNSKPEDFKKYADYEELLKKAKDDKLEAVIIALPSHLHAPAALAALDAGLHVLVETPMALGVADAKKMARKAKEKKLCLAVGCQRRYSYVYDNALELVRRGITDDLHYLRGQWHLKKEEKGDDDEKKPAKKGERKIDWWARVPKEDAAVKAAGYKDLQQLVQW